MIETETLCGIRVKNIVKGVKCCLLRPYLDYYRLGNIDVPHVFSDGIKFDVASYNYKRKLPASYSYEQLDRYCIESDKVVQLVSDGDEFILIATEETVKHIRNYICDSTNGIRYPSIIWELP